MGFSLFLCTPYIFGVGGVVLRLFLRRFSLFLFFGRSSGSIRNVRGSLLDVQGRFGVPGSTKSPRHHHMFPSRKKSYLNIYIT